MSASNRLTPIGGEPIWPRVLVLTGNPTLSRWAVRTGFATVLLGSAMVVGLHLLPDFGGVDPLHGMLSDYALRSDGWLFSLGLLVISIGSLALWGVLVRHRVLRGWLPMVFMAGWCVGLVCIALINKDANETNESIHGGVHLWVTAAGCASLPVVGVLIGLRHRNHGRWRGYARTSLSLALANVPCLLPFLIAFILNVATHSERYSGPATGLIERIMSVLDIVSLLVFGMWAMRATDDRAHGRLV
ncbi:MAG: DUF998 domain-containing protein [Sciscionella sp.]|nr:DUF998 domain-containing protein [Sciscionella sp.]